MIVLIEEEDIYLILNVYSVCFFVCVGMWYEYYLLIYYIFYLVVGSEGYINFYMVIGFWFEVCDNGLIWIFRLCLVSCNLLCMNI